MRHLPLVLAMLVALAASVQDGAAAQEPGSPTAEDSAQVRIALLDVLLDSLGPAGARSGRIWVRPAPEHRHPTRQEREAGVERPARLGARQWAAIERAFPTARLADQPMEALFVCPPGTEVRMPGSGCPIRDDGVIVGLGPLHIEGNSARAAGALIQSAVGPRWAMSWAQGFEAVFERVDGVWRLREIRSRWIT